MVQYDWSKLDTGWEINGTSLSEGHGAITRTADCATIVVDALENWMPYDGEHPSWVEFKASAKAQLAKCRISTNAQLVNDFLRQRDQAHERQRKYEATHGWRNPPCIYEEQSE